jgi:glutamate synthase (ferredoxin)
VRRQNHRLEEALDQQILASCGDALESGRPVALEFPIRNVHRTVGTRLGSEITRRHGGRGLPDDTIRLRFTGSAGQSFGAFVPRGMTMLLEGEANDHWGKGLSGGRLAVFPPRDASFAPEENIIIGNVALYGATSGEAYVRGVAGERFAVRNSGADAVVEGIGDHGCEYMTGGCVVVLGRTGRNFAAGMSGGVAFVLDVDGQFPGRCNLQMVDLEPLIDTEDVELVTGLLAQHVELTESDHTSRLLRNWAETARLFVRVMPRAYKRVLQGERRAGRQADALKRVERVHG